MCEETNSVPGIYTYPWVDLATARGKLLVQAPELNLNLQHDHYSSTDAEKEIGPFLIHRGLLLATLPHISRYPNRRSSPLSSLGPSRNKPRGGSPGNGELANSSCVIPSNGCLHCTAYMPTPRLEGFYFIFK